jgi:hypothetical protein
MYEIRGTSRYYAGTFARPFVFIDNLARNFQLL